LLRRFLQEDLFLNDPGSPSRPAVSHPVRAGLRRIGPVRPRGTRAATLSDRMRGRSQQLPRRDNSLIGTGYEKCQLAVTTITANAVNPAPGFSSKCCATGGYFWHSERQRYLRETGHAAH
jgi:hypothetical protein